MYSSVANTGTDGPLERASSADGNTNRPSSSGNAVGRSISSSGRPPRQPSKVSNGAYSELTPIHGTIPSSFEIDQPSLIHQPHAHWYHAAFHSICAVVGAGVLGLPYAFKYLGWFTGLTTLSVLFCVSSYTSYLLSELHEDGSVRLNTYREIGQYVWGERRGWWAVAPVQFLLMGGLCVTYTVTAGQSVKGIVSSDCSGEDCQEGLAGYCLLFGVVQLFLSQVPDFHSLWWVSLLGGVMSVGYCLIAVGGSLASKWGGDEAATATAPAPAKAGEDESQGESTADLVFGVMNALGSVAFTFGGQAVVPEIQATLATPPRSPSSMMKAVGVSYVLVFVLYYSVAISGYSAFGTSVEPDILLSIKHPAWLVDIADMMVVFHVAAGYQVFAMPLFDVIEGAVRSRMSKRPRPVVLRLVVRTLFVAVVTFIAILVPFFDDLMGLIASVGLMPITFILPPLLWISSRRPTGAEFWVNAVIAGGSVLLALVALVGSMRNIIADGIALHVGIDLDRRALRFPTLTRATHANCSFDSNNNKHSACFVFHVIVEREEDNRGDDEDRMVSTSSAAWGGSSRPRPDPTRSLGTHSTIKSPCPTSSYRLSVTSGQPRSSNKSWRSTDCKCGTVTSLRDAMRWTRSLPQDTSPSLWRSSTAGD